MRRGLAVLLCGFASAGCAIEETEPAREEVVAIDGAQTFEAPEEGDASDRGLVLELAWRGPPSVDADDAWPVEVGLVNRAPVARVVALPRPGSETNDDPRFAWLAEVEDDAGVFRSAPVRAGFVCDRGRGPRRASELRPGERVTLDGVDDPGGRVELDRGGRVRLRALLVDPDASPPIRVASAPIELEARIDRGLSIDLDTTPSVVRDAAMRIDELVRASVRREGRDEAVARSTRALSVRGEIVITMGDERHAFAIDDDEIAPGASIGLVATPASVRFSRAGSARARVELEIVDEDDASGVVARIARSPWRSWNVTD